MAPGQCGSFLRSRALLERFGSPCSTQAQVRPRHLPKVWAGKSHGRYRSETVRETLGQLQALGKLGKFPTAGEISGAASLGKKRDPQIREEAREHRCRRLAQSRCGVTPRFSPWKLLPSGSRSFAKAAGEQREKVHFPHSPGREAAPSPAPESSSASPGSEPDSPLQGSPGARPAGSGSQSFPLAAEPGPFAAFPARAGGGMVRGVWRWGFACTVKSRRELTQLLQSLSIGFSLIFVFAVP